MVGDFWTWSPRSYAACTVYAVTTNRYKRKCKGHEVLCLEIPYHLHGNSHPYLTLVCSDIGHSCQVHGESRDITMDLSQ